MLKISSFSKQDEQDAKVYSLLFGCIRDFFIAFAFCGIGFYIALRYQYG